MPRATSKGPARAAEAELARLMASIALTDELELEIEEAPAPRYLPPPLLATPIAAACSAPAPEVTPAQSDVSVSTVVISDVSPAPSACSQISSLSSPLSDSSDAVDLPPTQEAEEATELSDLPDDLLGWIFAFVDLEQLCRAARPVCHGWRGLVTVVIDTRLHHVKRPSP